MELFRLLGTILINTTDASGALTALMAQVASLQAALNTLDATLRGGSGAGELADDVEELGDAVDDLGDEIGDMGDAVNTGGGTLNAGAVWFGNMATMITNAALRLGRGVAQTGWEFNASMETYKAGLMSLMQINPDEAEAWLEKLHQFAIDTPLSLQGVMQQATQLLATGTAPEDLIERLSMLGDLSGGDMSKFTRIANAYWQVMSTGTLFAQDANQLTQAGIPIWQIMADYFNEIKRDGLQDWDVPSVRDLAKQAAKGKAIAVSSDEVLAALQGTVAPGGRYYGRMEEYMETTPGKLEKMNDAMQQAAGSFMQAFTDIARSETLERLTESFNGFIEWAEENPDVLNNVAKALSDLAVNGVDILLGSFQGLLGWWGEHQDEFDAMLVLLGGLAIRAGHGVAGSVLIATGAMDLWNRFAEEQAEEMSGLSDDTNLPYVKEQLEYQGKADQWEAFLEAWKNARRDEGFTDAEIQAYIDEQFANYTPANQTGVTTDETPMERKMREAFDEQMTRKTNGDDQKEWYTRDDVVPYGEGGGQGGGDIHMLLVQLQAVLTEMQAMPNKTAAAVTENMSNVTITATVNQGNVQMDGSTVGRLIGSYVNFQFGQQARLSGRGNA